MIGFRLIVIKWLADAFIQDRSTQHARLFKGELPLLFILAQPNKSNQYAAINQILIMLHRSMLEINDKYKIYRCYLYLSIETRLIRTFLSFVLLSLSLTRVKEFLFSFQVQVFASLILHFRTSVTQHQYLMVRRGSFWWIQLHFLASQALHRVQQAPWWAGRWLLLFQGIYEILPSFTQLFALTYYFWML